LPLRPPVSSLISRNNLSIFNTPRENLKLPASE
jgi:hypothetical protein